MVTPPAPVWCVAICGCRCCITAWRSCSCTAGGGFLGDRGELRAWQSLYAGHNYLTLSADYLKFNDETPAPVYPQPESDVKAAVQFLCRHAHELSMDPDKIVVHGFSAGAGIGAQLAPSSSWGRTTPRSRARPGGRLRRTASPASSASTGTTASSSSQPDRYYGGGASGDPTVRARWKSANSDAAPPKPPVPSC